MRDLSVEFASGRRQFKPADWQPSRYLASGHGHKKGDPCFRHRTHTRETMKHLPAGYRAEGDQIVPESQSSSITLPAVFAPPTTEMYPADYTSGNPYHVYISVVRDLAAYPEYQRDRLHRLALLAMADTEADKLHPAARAVFPHALRFADDPQKKVPAGVARQSLDAPLINSRDYYVMDAILPFDRPISIDLPPYQRLYRAVVISGSDATLTPSQAMTAAAHAQTIRSIARVGPPLTIPVNRDIRDMAQAAYDGHSRDTMRVLADALEDEGAPQAALDNLRNPNSAIRGNWVLDAILGKR